jgi:ArsR family metal-binding transcriptional regulator
MNKPIVFDELTYAKNLLENGFTTKKIEAINLSYLAKYFRNQGMGFKKVEDNLIDVCRRHDPFFNPIVSKKLLNEAIKIGKKFRLKEIIPVFITKSEIDVLKSVDSQIERILFTMLVLAKFDKFQNTKISKSSTPIPHGYYANYKLETILEYAHVRIFGKNLLLLKHELDGKSGLLSATLHEESSWKVNFASDSDDPVILIDDYTNIYKYLPSFCSVCGKMIFKNSNRQKMCTDCFEKKQNERVWGNCV